MEEWREIEGTPFESTQGYFEVIDNKWDNPEFLE